MGTTNEPSGAAVQDSTVGSGRRIGGRTALDFLNTVDLHTPDRPGEQFVAYRDLLSWSQEGGDLSDSDSRHLSDLALSRPLEAEAVLLLARDLREAIYRALVAQTSGEPPSASDLAMINVELGKAMSAAFLRPAAERGVIWVWDRPGTAVLESVLWPAVRDAADLLASIDSGRVRQCESDDCDWMFLDTSRNHSRRWCSMEDCGNRAKAKRHYHRRRAAERA